MNTIFLGNPPACVYDWLKRKALSEPFCIEAVTDGTVKIAQNGSAPSIALVYSVDRKSWNDWDHVTGTELVAGQKLYLKAKTENKAFGTNNYIYNCFTTTCKFNVSGNIMSLLYDDFKDKTELTNAYALVSLFHSCSMLVDASRLMLPAMTLASYCYNSMFSGCTSLTAAPELPATTLASYCYSYMFYNCTSLTAAPELPATTLENSCYSSMFSGCTQVNELHYASSVQTDTMFTSMTGTPWFGATNATVYYDL